MPTSTVLRRCLLHLANNILIEKRLTTITTVLQSNYKLDILRALNEACKPFGQIWWSIYWPFPYPTNLPFSYIQPICTSPLVLPVFVGKELRSSQRSSLEIQKRLRFEQGSRLVPSIEIEKCIWQSLLTIKLKSNTSLSDEIINFAKCILSAPSFTNLVEVGLNSPAVTTISLSAHLNSRKDFPRLAFLKSWAKTTEFYYYQKLTKLIHFPEFLAALLLYDASPSPLKM